MALVMFPAAFRGRYGREIWQCIRDARYELGDESRALTIRFWIGIMADLGRSAVMEWYRSTPRESYYLAVRRISGAVLIAAALVNVGYDAMSVKLSMGVFAGLLTAVGAITGTMLIRKTLVILTFAATLAEAQPGGDTAARVNHVVTRSIVPLKAIGSSATPKFSAASRATRSSSSPERSSLPIAAANSSSCSAP